MALGFLGAPERRTPGSARPPAVDAGERVHFALPGSSRPNGGFVVATADVAFAAESGVAAVVAVSFVAAAAAHAAAAAAAAVAAAVHAVGAE